MFHVGQLVVCIIDPSEWVYTCKAVLPQKGQVYTVRSSWSYTDTGEQYIRLEEIVNPSVRLGWRMRWRKWEPGYNSIGFRPVSKTHTEIIASLLHPVPEKEPAA